MKRKNRIEEYCETTFNCLKANVHNWGKPDYARPISRIYYSGVLDPYSRAAKFSIYKDTIEVRQFWDVKGINIEF